MRKFFITLMLLLIICATFISCNMQVVDMTYKFDRAMVSLPNGDIVEGKLDSWVDYDGSDQIQVTINGITYYCHHSDVVLIKEGEIE